MNERTVELGYKGHSYYAKDVRFWLRSKADLFVYGSSDDLKELLPQANDFVGIWDRNVEEWVE